MNFLDTAFLIFVGALFIATIGFFGYVIYKAITTPKSDSEKSHVRQD